MTTFRVGSIARVAVLAATIAAVPFAGTAAAAEDTTGPADVSIGDVSLGPGGEWMNVSVTARCDEPNVVGDLVVEVSQDAGARFGSVAGDLGVTCDGAPHALDLQIPSFGGRWHGGTTLVQASFSIYDPVTGDPVDQAVDSVGVDVRAPADVELRHRAKLRPSGAVVLRLRVRCSDELVVQDLEVELSQGSVGASKAGDFGIECDGRWERVRLRLRPLSGWFHPGDADAFAYLTVLDPDSFDPVWQARDTETLTLV